MQGVVFPVATTPLLQYCPQPAQCQTVLHTLELRRFQCTCSLSSAQDDYKSRTLGLNALDIRSHAILGRVFYQKPRNRWPGIRNYLTSTNLQSVTELALDYAVLDSLSEALEVICILHNLERLSLVYPQISKQANGVSEIPVGYLLPPGLHTMELGSFRASRHVALVGKAQRPSSPHSHVEPLHRQWVGSVPSVRSEGSHRIGNRAVPSYNFSSLYSSPRYVGI